MKIAFCTHVSDDWYFSIGCQKLERSAKYFHPEIPFFTFKSDAINKEFAKDPRVNWCTIHPVITSRLVDYFDLVVHFDADSIITGPLDAVIEGDYEVAGVRCNNDLGKAGADPGITYEDIGVDRYLNTGLVAATNKQFWSEWSHLTLTQSFPYGEGGSFNKIFYSGKYKTKLLDPLDAEVYYGISGLNGNSPASHYETWKEIKIKDHEMYIWDKKVKVIHQAGSGGKYRFQPHLFNKEALAYLETITQTKFS
jgi:hypothetical protein